MWKKLLAFCAALASMIAVFGCTPLQATSVASPTTTPTVTPPSTDLIPPSPQLSKEDWPAEQVVYYLSGHRDEEYDRSEIWRASLDGTNQELIFQKTRRWETVQVFGGTSVESWSIQILELSPDGQKLAFADVLGYGTEPGPLVWFHKQISVWVIDMDGSQPTELFHFTAEDDAVPSGECVVWKIAWSPDSTRLLLHRSCGPYSADNILLVHVLTGEVVEMGPGAGGTWSPDGQHIAYARNGDPEDPGDVYGLYVATTDGREKERIFRWERFDGYNTGPDWSPDGEYLVFVDGKWRTYSIAPDGTQLQQLPVGGGGYPQWSPDGRYISFAGGINLSLYVLDVHKGREWELWNEVLPKSVEWSTDSRFVLIQTQGQYDGVYYVRVENGARYRIPVSGASPTW